MRCVTVDVPTAATWGPMVPMTRHTVRNAQRNAERVVMVVLICWAAGELCRVFT